MERRNNKARYIYLSLTDQMEIMGVPIDIFKIIGGFSGLLYLLTRNLMTIFIFIVLMIAARTCTAVDYYYLPLLKKHFLEFKEFYDA